MEPKIELSLIAAYAYNKDGQKVIGTNIPKPKMLWHLPKEFGHFKNTTMGYPLIMGRVNYESLPGLLPGREHVIFSKNWKVAPEGTYLVKTASETLDLLHDMGAKKAYVIGGSQIYEKLFPLANELILTELDKQYEGEVILPDFPIDNWKKELIGADSSVDKISGDQVGYQILRYTKP